MNIIKIVVSIGVIVPVMALDAKEKKPDITIENHSNRPIRVFFRAAGCAGVSKDLRLVCKSQKIQPHTPTGPGSSSYDWKWGQSGKKVVIRVGHTLYHLNKKPEGKYLWRGEARPKDGRIFSKSGDFDRGRTYKSFGEKRGGKIKAKFERMFG